MKKVINGKLYNTETAQELGSYSYGNGYRDFNHYSEELYRKRTGEFFLYGEGGPNSKYAVSTGQNSWSGSEKITPLTYEQAQDWAEKNLEADEYIEIFGEPDEGEGEKERLNIMVTRQTAARIRQEAAKAEMTLGEYIERVISGQLLKQGEKI